MKLIQRIFHQRCAKVLMVIYESTRISRGSDAASK